jgi:hypothetical protein
MNIKEVFEQAIARQEHLVFETAFQFDDETDEEFQAKVEGRLKRVCIGLGHARQFPGINGICPGQEVVWEGFYIQRRRVDQLDNIYVSRAA